MQDDYDLPRLARMSPHLSFAQCTCRQFLNRFKIRLKAFFLEGGRPLPYLPITTPIARCDRQSRAFLVLIAVVFAIICHCTVSEAGELSIKPSIVFQLRYDDNINLTQNDRVASFIPETLPSIILSYRTPIWDLSLSETFDWWYYLKTNQGNWSNAANLFSKLTLLENLLYFDVADVYANEVINPRGRSTDINLNVNRTDTNDLNAIPYLKYQIDMATAAITAFTYTNLWYRTDGINRQQYKGSLGLEHRFTETFNGLLAAEYLADRPANFYSDDNQTAVFASLLYKINERTRVDGTVGYRWISFSSGRDYNKPIYNIGLVYQLSEKGLSEKSASEAGPSGTTYSGTGFSIKDLSETGFSGSGPAGTERIELRASQLFSVSPVDGLVENTLQQLVWHYGEQLSFDGSVYHRKDFYFQLGQTDETVIGVQIGLVYKPSERTAYRVSGSYEKDRYLPQDDLRNVYQASAGIDYKLTPKATIRISYYFNKSSGQIITDNYTDNTAELQLRLEI